MSGILSVPADPIGVAALGGAQAVRVHSGTVFVFVLPRFAGGTGRRIPLAQVTAPGVVVGADLAGADLIITTLAETELEQVDSEAPLTDAEIKGWVRALEPVTTRSVPPRLDVLGSQPEALGGDQVVTLLPAAPHDPCWVEVQAGALLLDGFPQASVRPADGPVPVPAGSWLCATSGTTARQAPAPEDPHAGAGALTRLAALSALGWAQVAYQADADSQVMQGRHDDRLVRDALVGLATAVPGRLASESAVGEADRDLLVVSRLAGQVGLRPESLRLRRALSDADVTGRDRINALAGACGASVRKVNLGPGWWRREGPPMLVNDDLTDGSVAVVWRRGSYRVLVPGVAAGDTVTAARAQSLARSAVLLQPLLDPAKPASVRDLIRLAARGSGRSVGAVLWPTLIVGLLTAVIPIVSGRLTNTVASQTTSTLLVIGGALALLAVGDMAVRAIRGYALLRIRGKAVSVAGAAMWDRLLRLPMPWHARRPVASRTWDANTVDYASRKVSDAAATALLDVVAVCGSLLAVLTVSVPLSLVVLGFLLVRGVLEVGLVRRAAALSRRQLDSAAVSQGVVLDLVRGVNRLRVSDAVARGFARWAKQQADTTRIEVKQRRVALVQNVGGVFWPTIGLGFLLLVTAETNASVGALVTAQTALVAATAALAAGVGSLGACLSAMAGLRRAEPVLLTVPESAGGEEIQQLVGGLDMSDIVFRYEPGTSAVLNGVSASIRPGEHVAIVGPSGCGKTTLLRLILGLDDPESGVVTFDGRDIAGLDRAAVRRQIGSVMQSSALLPGTIRENVDLGRGLSIEEVWRALIDAAVADEVRDMPMGLSTLVVEGAATVSGGQRQRILLARALAAQPRILILDEATSALDNVSQAAIVANLDRLRITRIVVAHRLSTIRRADRIVVLDGGVVVQSGPYEELASVDGPFHDLIARQQV